MGFFGGQKNKEVKQKVLCSVYDNTRTADQEIETMSHVLNDLLRQPLNEGREIIFLCVGSDRSIGDALGPLVGTMLKEEDTSYCIYGTLEEPVHAFNLESTLKAVKRRFGQPFIISIDAGIGEKEQVGAVLLKEGPLLPGQALKKVLPAVGDYHLTGVVNYLDPLPAAQFLNDTRLHTVMKLAKTIVRVITHNEGCS